MQFNLADLFESLVDVVPQRIAVVAGDKKQTYAALDLRANRLVHEAASSLGGGGSLAAVAHSGGEGAAATRLDRSEGD